VWACACVYIYRESWAMMLCIVRIVFVLLIDSLFSKFKWSIQPNKMIFCMKITWFSYYEPFKRSNFLIVLKNSKKILKNVKFSLSLDIHTKIILYGWIDHLHFDNKEPIHSTEVIRAMHSIIAQLYIYMRKAKIQCVAQMHLCTTLKSQNLSSKWSI
jgi:hypothetical protein